MKSASSVSSVTPSISSKGIRRLSSDEKLESLSIDDVDDFGGDPYNHTGSFYAPKFDNK